MFKIHTDKIGTVAVVECEGRLIQSDAAFKLRDAVTSQADAKVVVLDLSEVYAVEHGGLGILIFLQGWMLDHKRALQCSLIRQFQDTARDSKNAARLFPPNSQ